ncbi:hypothetical protein Tco_1563620 [Tanacetum coccineum]
MLVESFLRLDTLVESLMNRISCSLQPIKDDSQDVQNRQKKKFNLNLEIFRDIFHIYPRVHGQNFDELPTNEVIVYFFKKLSHTGEIKSITDVVVDQMHQPWRTFATLINISLFGKTTAIPPKIARKIKKTSPTKKDINLNLVPVDEEPKSVKKKVYAKKTTRKQSTGVVLRDTHMVSSFKKKEKVNVDRGKGIELLSEVALTEETQMKEVRKKSMREFHRTHPSGSGIVSKIPPSAAKIKPSVTNEGSGDKPGVPNVTEEESTKSEAKSWGKDKDEKNNDHDSGSECSDQENDSDDDNTQSDNVKGSDSEQETDENESGSESNQQENEEEVKDDDEEEEEFVKTPSNYTPTNDEDETNEESKINDNSEGDEDKGMDDTTNLLYDDVDVRMNVPVLADEGIVQKEGTNAEMINVKQGNENLEITLDQVIEDAHVTISTIAKKTEVPVTSSSHSSDLVAKFLNFADIPRADAEIVSPIDVHVHHEEPSNQTPTLLTLLVTVITESSLAYTTTISQSLPSFTPQPPISTPTLPPTTEATNP